MWWKKKEKKEEKKTEEKEVDLLKELCKDDAELYNILGRFLVINPLAGISQKDIETLTGEAEKSGNYSPAVDKAIFEATKNPEEREKYIKIIQDLSSKTIHATEQRKEEAEKEGLTDRAATLEKKIQDQKFISERAEDILNVASVFYSEKLLELGEEQRREERGKEREMAEGNEWRMGEQEKRDREARKKDRKKMSKEERTEAEQQDKREELAAEERKATREEEKREAESEEMRIKEQEKRDREARRDERSQNQ
jgi:hypothetical protein